MAALYGRMRAGRGEVTRCGHDHISATLETWEGSIRTLLAKDGTFTVSVGPKHGGGRIIATGNVNGGERSAEFHPLETLTDA